MFSEHKSESEWDRLPKDLWLLIFQKLDTKFLLNLRSVDKCFRDYIDTECLLKIDFNSNIFTLFAELRERLNTLMDKEKEHEASIKELFKVFCEKLISNIKFVEESYNYYIIPKKDLYPEWKEDPVSLSKSRDEAVEQITNVVYNLMPREVDSGFKNFIRAVQNLYKQAEQKDIQAEKKDAAFKATPKKIIFFQKAISFIKFLQNNKFVYIDVTKKISIQKYLKLADECLEVENISRLEHRKSQTMLFGGTIFSTIIILSLTLLGLTFVPSPNSSEMSSSSSSGASFLARLLVSFLSSDITFKTSIALSVYGFIGLVIVLPLVYCMMGKNIKNVSTNRRSNSFSFFKPLHDTGEVHEEHDSISILIKESDESDSEDDSISQPLLENS